MNISITNFDILHTDGFVSIRYLCQFPRLDLAAKGRDVGGVEFEGCGGMANCDRWRLFLADDCGGRMANCDW
ncbi:hypothetical protein F2Q70_00004884 [Brassica cretica]|uniref:Uncharacterized protein n=1 Tax=Brassica cretica TaxID=69181 RepID=A0A8S9ITZ7_BRACR|nr:hypothetical protein F2Q70_00004884 [Brassica cretica]